MENQGAGGAGRSCLWSQEPESLQEEAACALQFFLTERVLVSLPFAVNWLRFAFCSPRSNVASWHVVGF